MTAHETRLRLLFGKDLERKNGTPQPFGSSGGRFDQRVQQLEMRLMAMEKQLVRDSMTASSDRHGNKLSSSSQNVDRSIMALS